MSIDLAQRTKSHWRPFTQALRTGGHLPLSAEDAKTPLMKELVSLQSEHTTRLGQLADRKREADAAAEAVPAAEAALRAEIQRAANAGEVSDKEPELLAALDKARAAADRRLHTQRVEAAEGLATQARDRIDRFIDKNGVALIEELHPEGEKVAQAIRKAYEKIAPQVKEWNRLHALGAYVAGRTLGFVQEDIPSDVNKVCSPLPKIPDEARPTPAPSAGPVNAE